MHLETAVIRQVLLDSIRDQVPATRNVADNELIRLIDGFPGVLDRWLSDSQREEMKSISDLQREAAAAQDYRYLEFDVLLPRLSGDERQLAIRLTLFSGLDRERCEVYHDILFDGLDAQLVCELHAKNVLEGNDF